MTSMKLEQSIVTTDNRLSTSVTFPNSGEGYHFSLYTLNRDEMIAPFTTWEKRVRRLRLHGLAVRSDKKDQSFVRQYLIGIFQCQSIFSYVSNDKTYWLVNGKLQTPHRFYRLSDRKKSAEAKRMERMAKRAIYALGWDYGIVRLGKGSQGKSVVLDVLVRPKLSPYMINAFQDAFARYEKKLPQLTSRPSQLRLGADPEFILVDSKGNLKMASQYFGRRGLVGCDAIWYGNNRANKPLVEIRPGASKSPRELLLHLYQGMLIAARKINEPGTKWLAGALPHPKLPIGGHIHFSGIPLVSAFLRALDNYLTLPLVLVEDERGIKRRPKYGFLGDFREQYHGGFEYRTPPSWLVSPTLTKGVFSLAKLIALNYPYLKYLPLNDVAIQNAYYNGDKTKISPIVPKLWSEIVDFAEYAQEQRNLDAYYDYLMSGQTWDETEDIRKKWRIPPFHKRTKR